MQDGMETLFLDVRFRGRDIHANGRQDRESRARYRALATEEKASPHSQAIHCSQAV